MLPHLIGRPATRKRWPNGIDGPSFFVKEVESGIPVRLSRVQVAQLWGGRFFRTELVERRIGDPVLGEPVCSVAGCDRAGDIRLLCRSHHHRWMAAGRPEMVEYVRSTSPQTLSAELNPGPQVLRPFDFRPVKGQLRLKWQYLLQCRHDGPRSRDNVTQSRLDRNGSRV